MRVKIGSARVSTAAGSPSLAVPCDALQTAAAFRRISSLILVKPLHVVGAQHALASVDLAYLY